MPSQYKTINQVKYERDLLDFVDKKTANGVALSYRDAVKLWEMALDGNKVTATERQTVEYIIANKQLHPEAKSFLSEQLASHARQQPSLRRGSGSQHWSNDYFTHEKGVKVKKKLINRVKELAEKGPISECDAIQLWGLANDGNKVTKVERETLEYALREYAFDHAARIFLDKALNPNSHSSSSGKTWFAPLGDMAPQLALPWRGKRQQRDENNGDGEGGERQHKKSRVGVEGNRLALTADSTSVQQDGGKPGWLKRMFGFGGSAKCPPAAQAPSKIVSGSASSAAAGAPSGKHFTMTSEQEQLLAEQDGDSFEQTYAIEDLAPAPVSDEFARQKAEAKAEVNRILECPVKDILGRGAKDEKLREFRRLALRLHPDKGFVAKDDERAGFAWRLVQASRKRLQQS